MTVITTIEKPEPRIAPDRSFEVTSPAPRSAWRELIQLDPDALVTQSPQWLDCLIQAGNYSDASRYYQFSDGQRLVLPLIRRQMGFGLLSSLSSFPNSWGMGGVLSADPLQPQDLQIVLADLTTMGDTLFSIRPNPLKAEVWASALPETFTSVPRLAHVLDLEGGFATIWEKRFRSPARTAIRKAEKSGLVVEKDTTGKLIPAFYQLFDQSLARWSSKQHEPAALARFRGHRRDPRSKFETIARGLGSACQVWIAWLNGEPAAGIMVLQGKNANYTRGAMNKDLAGPVRANDLLHRLAIEDACQAGCRYYHMGETGESASLAAFKSNFGAQPVPYAEIQFERLPITRLENTLKGALKKVIGFQDA